MYYKPLRRLYTCNRNFNPVPPCEKTEEIIFRNTQTLTFEASKTAMWVKITESEKYHKPIHYPDEEVEIVDPITGETIKKRY